MPKMDGFTFLRILMNRQPTPVIVISSYSRKQNVFKALELGALDFIAKPTRYLSPELHRIRDELVEKVLMVRALQSSSLLVRTMVAEAETGPDAEQPDRRQVEPLPAFGLVVVGASTGGPPALQTLLQTLPRHLPLAYMIAQHMPENFTKAFADRLDRYTGLQVFEAEGSERVLPGRAFVAPGGHHLEVERRSGELLTRVVRADEGAKYIPSIDALFRSAAEAMGANVLAILLTGMGTDGCGGIRMVKSAGGHTVAESEETAVIYGMPKEAIDDGQVDVVLRLDEMAVEVIRFSERVSKKPGAV
jgi:two-component system chemotaxis response regulator CheB